MIVYRILRLIVHLLVGMATCAFVFPLIDATGRERRIKQWSVKVLAICRVQVTILGIVNGQPLQRALSVSNHVSWLDIFVINSLQPCRFVAKSDIRDWPLIGWLCEKTDTVFIARGRQRDVRKIYEGLVADIRAGDRIAFFPEGTTSPQGAVLPFHANLFEAAIEAAVPIQPYAVRYTDRVGGLHSAVDFVGEMTFAQSLVAIMGGGTITAELMILPVIETGGAHRRELAAAARQSIGTALGYWPK